MKLLSQLAMVGLAIVSLNHASSKDKVTKIKTNVPGLGICTDITIKHKNGCITQKSVFPGGSSSTIQVCPPPTKTKTPKKR